MKISALSRWGNLTARQRVFMCSIDKLQSSPTKQQIQATNSGFPTHRAEVEKGRRRYFQLQAPTVATAAAARVKFAASYFSVSVLLRRRWCAPSVNKQGLYILVDCCLYLSREKWRECTSVGSQWRRGASAPLRCVSCRVFAISPFHSAGLCCSPRRAGLYVVFNKPGPKSLVRRSAMLCIKR